MSFISNRINKYPKQLGDSLNVLPLPQNMSASTFFCGCVQATRSLSKVVVIPAGKVEGFQR